MFRCNLYIKSCRQILKPKSNRWFYLFLLIIAFFLIRYLIFLPYLNHQTHTTLILPRVRSNLTKYDDHKPEVTLVVVACGQKRSVADNALILIKSAILVSKDVILRIIVFRDESTDEGQTETLESKLATLADEAGSLGQKMWFEIKESSYPSGEDEDWRNMYMTCCTQRLFFPSLLPRTDALIYVDADTLFLTNMKDIWDNFKKFTPDQVASMINEVEPPSHDWYNKIAEHPYYGPRGMNSGVMLMNLTRMRDINFEHKMRTVYKTYKSQIRFIDQDILNILFHNRPELIHPLNCQYNFRHGHCMCYYENTGNCRCQQAEQEGISIVHGNLFGFKRFPLQILQVKFKKYNLTMNDPGILLSNIERDFANITRRFPTDLVKNPCLRPSVFKSLLSKFRKYIDYYHST